MGSSVIVFLDPFPCQVSNLFKVHEHVGVKNSFPIQPIESLYVTVLHGFTRLDILIFNPLILTPELKIFGSELRSVVCSDCFGFTSLFNNALQCAYDPFS